MVLLETKITFLKLTKRPPEFAKSAHQMKSNAVCCYRNIQCFHFLLEKKNTSRVVTHTNSDHMTGLLPSFSEEVKK